MEENILREILNMLEQFYEQSWETNPFRAIEGFILRIFCSYNFWYEGTNSNKRDIFWRAVGKSIKKIFVHTKTHSWNKQKKKNTTYKFSVVWHLIPTTRISQQKKFIAQLVTFYKEVITKFLIQLKFLQEKNYKSSILE